MPLFRKKPIIVNAMRLTHTAKIQTLEGVMTGHAGDWLIIGVNGEIYPCKDDVFQKTYDPVVAVDGSPDQDRGLDGNTK